MNKGNVSLLAIMAAAAVFMTAPAVAADLGGDCCADLEERVADLEATTVRKGNRKVSVKLYGQVSRAMLIWDNGTESDQYSVGNENSGSRFGMKGKAKIGGGWSAGYRLEWGTGDTLAHKVTESDDDSKDGETDAEGLSLRHEFVYLKNKQFGKVTLGHTSTATDGIVGIDLGGTSIIASSDVDDWQGDFGIVAGGTAWDKYFNDLSGSRGDIIRYDSPTLANLKISASWGEDDYWDAALRYANEFAGVRFAAGVGYQNGSIKDDDADELEVISGSASVLHVGTGLNLTVAAGERTYGDDTADASYYYLKAGWVGKVNSLGKTKVYGEYAAFSDYRIDDGDLVDLGGAGTAEGSEVTMYGFGVVQTVSAAAMDLFAGYRHYELDIDGSTTNGTAEFDAVLAGARIKF